MLFSLLYLCLCLYSCHFIFSLFILDFTTCLMIEGRLLYSSKICHLLCFFFIWADWDKDSDPDVLVDEDLWSHSALDLSSLHVCLAVAHVQVASAPPATRWIHPGRLQPPGCQIHDIWGRGARLRASRVHWSLFTDAQASSCRNFTMLLFFGCAAVKFWLMSPVSRISTSQMVVAGWSDKKLFYSLLALKMTDLLGSVFITIYVWEVLMKTLLQHKVDRGSETRPFHLCWRM